MAPGALEGIDTRWACVEEGESVEAALAAGPRGPPNAAAAPPLTTAPAAVGRSPPGGPFSHGRRPFFSSG